MFPGAGTWQGPAGPGEAAAARGYRGPGRGSGAAATAPALVRAQVRGASCSWAGPGRAAPRRTRCPGPAEGRNRARQSGAISLRFLRKRLGPVSSPQPKPASDLNLALGNAARDSLAPPQGAGNSRRQPLAEWPRPRAGLCDSLCCLHKLGLLGSPQHLEGKWPCLFPPELSGHS